MTTQAHLLRAELRDQLRPGLHNIVTARVVAERLSVSERTIRALVGELIDEGHLIGSSPGSSPGYWIIASRAELDLGTHHLVSRARSMFTRVSSLRRAAEREFGRGDDVLTLFELDPSPVMAGAEGGMS